MFRNKATVCYDFIFFICVEFCYLILLFTFIFETIRNLDKIRIFKQQLTIKAAQFNTLFITLVIQKPTNYFFFFFNNLRL